MVANGSCKKGQRTLGMVLLVVMISTTSAIGVAGTNAAQGPVTPGPVACAQIVPMVEQNLAGSCSTLDQDQACYVNQTARIEYADNVNTIIPFAKVGDIVPLNVIKSITTSPLDLQTGEWGLAALKVQASPSSGTTAGQTVIVFLYGNAYMTDLLRTSATAATPTACTGTTTRATYLRGAPASTGASLQLLQAKTTVTITGRSANDLWLQAESQGATGWLSAQAVKLSCTLSNVPQVGVTPPAILPALSGFYFSTGVGPQAACKDTPSGGLFIATPKGMTVAFRANGAEITISSAAVLYAKPHNTMSVVVLDGQATVEAYNFLRTVKAGQIVSLPLGGPLGRDVIGPPGAVYRVQAGLLFASSVCRFARAVGLSDVPCDMAGVLATPTPTTP